MCGLLALISADYQREIVKRANSHIIHRGPDDGHFYWGDGVALAARRLSIIDLDGGRQPLCNEDGSIWITYNGEVFNAPELRQQLLAKGHQFRTHSDTEVLVHAYEEWGTAMVAMLRGMFAFAIWDARRDQLFVGRDRFGIKPLYYAQVGEQFACASEITPLFDLLPRLTRRANHQALSHLFEVGFVPTPLTMFANVYSLPAAHYLVVKAGSVTLQRYWQLEYRQPYLQLSFEEATEVFMAQLRESVAAWRMSDVPVGSLLSGGIDSSTLAAILTEQAGQIHTFNLAFRTASHDESARARQTAQHLGSVHHELMFGSAEFDHLPHVIRHLESPQCSATSIAIFLLYRACRDAGLKVIMTGEGADELLGGYHWFDGDRRMQPFLRLPRFLRRQIAQLPLPMSASARRVMRHGDRRPVARYALWQQLNSADDRARLLKTPLRQTASQRWEAAYGDSIVGLASLNQFLALDTQTRMVDFINVEVDRMSMAASVEARPPFLDSQLWAFATQLPPTFKLNAKENKRVLRAGATNLLDKGMLVRPKKGLATPHAQWWRQTALPAWAEACLQPSALQETDYFNLSTVFAMREAHQRGDADYSRLLTGVLTTQLWHDMFL